MTKEKAIKEQAKEKISVALSLKDTFAHVMKCKAYLLLSVIIDIIFFIILGTVFLKVNQNIIFNLEKLYTMIQEYLSVAGSNMIDYISESDIFMTNPDFLLYLNDLVKWVAILMVSIYFIYVLFQGLSWACAMRILEKKWRNRLRFFRRFMLINFIWICIFYVFIYTWIKMSLYSKLSVFPLLSQQFINGLFILATLLLGYFTIHSYPLLTWMRTDKAIQKTLFFGLKYANPLLIVYLLSLSSFVYFAYVYKVMYITNLNFFLVMLFSLIIVIPGLTFIRVLIADMMLKHHMTHAVPMPKKKKK